VQTLSRSFPLRAVPHPFPPTHTPPLIDIPFRVCSLSVYQPRSWRQFHSLCFMQCLDLNQQRGDNKHADDASGCGGGAMWCITHFRLCKGICAHTERRHCRGDQHALCMHLPKTGAHSEHGSHAPPKHASTTPPPKTGTLNTRTRVSSESATGFVVGAVPRHATFGHLRANTRRYTWACESAYKVSRNSHHGCPST
jgi:hypothetical protein